MTTLQSPGVAPRESAPLRLSIMMFLQYAVWGIWLPYLSVYLNEHLGFTAGQVGWILGLAGSIGAITSPFLAGQIADRFINAEKYLGLLLIAGGVIKFCTYYADDYGTFLALSIAYSVVYMPTLALTNSIAFAHLRSPEVSFAPVRMFGTIGWIVASTAFPLLWLQYNLHPTVLPPFIAGTDKPDAIALIGDCLRVSGVISVLYGAWALIFLPRTPPTRNVEHPLAFLEAFSLFRRPSMLVLAIAAVLIAMIHQVYFIRTSPYLTDIGFSASHAGPIMAIGQLAEILVLAGLGLFIRGLGYKWTLILGAASFALRYAIFAVATPDTRLLALLAMTLHGLCYACFFAASYIYIERVARPDIRHSAQTVYGIIILGVGPVLAGFYNEWLTDVAAARSDAVFNWSPLWWVQAGVGFGAAILLLLAFRPEVSAAPLIKLDPRGPFPSPNDTGLRIAPVERPVPFRAAPITTPSEASASAASPASARVVATRDVFICHAAEDKTIADGLCAILERRNIRCWIAPRDIVPGVNWSEAIIDGIAACRTLVLVYSGHSNSSPQVLREIERAVSRGLAIVPFRVEDVPLSKSMEYFISTPHWLDAMTPPMEKHMQTLANTIETLLGKKS